MFGSGGLAEAESLVDTTTKLLYITIVNGRDVVKKLQSEGWFVARVKGSHHIMKLEGRPGSVPVPVHGSRDLSKALVKMIEKQTGVNLL